mgnify:CR=1 FL=1
MKKVLKSIRPVVLSFAFFTLICGLLYPLSVTLISGMVFPHQAEGSLITITTEDHQTSLIGSSLMGQTFTQPQYMIGRPSGSTNLSPVSIEYQKIIEARIAWWHAFDPSNTAKIPSDLIQASASGVDPYISVDAANYQVSRIARVRGLSEEAVRALIKAHTIHPFLGLWGDPVVNVLEVNLALDGLKA